jgi:23S rRNA pseudouridine1911/1915/1917 synthase
VQQSFHFTLPPGQRLDRFLVEAMAAQGENLSRARLQKIINEGAISGVPAHKLKSAYKSKVPVEISVTLAPESDVVLKPLDTGIPVLYEDEYLAIVHKPAGMTVHPGAGTSDDTMVHALLGTIDTLAPHSERPGIVHRLDRETEGLMVVAKTEKSRTALSAMFAERQIHKTYTALVWGKVTLPELMSGFIWRDIHNRKKMRFGLEGPAEPLRVRDAELVITEQIAHRFATRLVINLITGRTHQIRASCAHFRAPIVGDALYGQDASKFQLYKIGRERKSIVEASGMMLVANAINFKHPFKRKKLDFKIDLPQRFMNSESALSGI